MPGPTSPLDQFSKQKTVVLTTFRKSGVGVPTAVNIAVDGERAFAKTWDASGKYKRIRNNPHVTVAPSDFKGNPTGPGIAMTAHVIDGADFALARRLIERKHPVLQGILVRLGQRMTNRKTVVMELRPE